MICAIIEGKPMVCIIYLFIYLFIFVSKIWLHFPVKFNTCSELSYSEKRSRKNMIIFCILYILCGIELKKIKINKNKQTKNLEPCFCHWNDTTLLAYAVTLLHGEESLSYLLKMLAIIQWHS